MPDLHERFASLSRTPAPDLWRDIQGREPRPSDPPSRTPRALAAGVALLVALGGIGVVVFAFRGEGVAPEPPTTAGVAPTNGQILYRVGGEGGTTWFSVLPDGSEHRVVFEGEPMRIAQVAWSPDGSKIAYQNPIAAERGIFVANADGSDPIRLTEGVNDGWPTWSPDGTAIVFSSTRFDPSVERCDPAGLDAACPTDIYVMGADGSDVTRLTDDSVADYDPSWSPDGGLIAFERNTDPTIARPAIFTMRSDGSDVRQVSSGDGGSDFRPTWSPDGSELVFAAIRNEEWGIWVVDADGSNERMILGGTDAGYIDNPVWSPDGELIAFVGNLTVDDYSPEDALYVMRPDGGAVTRIATESAGIAGDIAWQPLLVPIEVGVPLPTGAEVVDTFEVGTDVRSVVYGEGSVWVAASNDDGSFGGRILRIDPETHEVQAEIPVDVLPTWEVGGGAMVVAGGSLWVTGSLEAPGNFDDPGRGADAAVTRIDTTMNEVVQTFALGGAHGADLTFLNGELWVLLFGDETVDNSMEVVRVDVAAGDILDRYRLDANWAHTLVASDGRLVTIVGGDDDVVNAGGSLIGIDPATSAITSTEFPAGSHTLTPILWQGQVWISMEPGFTRFDPLVEAFLEPHDLPSRFSDCCGSIAADDRGIWFLSLRQPTGTQLNAFDPETGALTELVELTGGTPVTMALARDSVWILNYEGTLTHVALG